MNHIVKDFFERKNKNRIRETHISLLSTQKTIDLNLKQNILTSVGLGKPCFKKSISFLTDFHNLKVHFYV